MALAHDEDALVRASAALAARDADALRRALTEAARAADARRVEEVLLQSYLFVGFPLTLDAMTAWREVSDAEAPSTAAVDREAWAPRGADVCARVYGAQARALRHNVRALHPDLELWMVEEGYGKVLGRPGLDLRVRELCIVALLTVLDVPRQLYSHLRGALHAGASPTEVRGALDRGLELASGGARARALETWERLRTRSEIGA